MSFPCYERYKESGVEWLGEVPEHWEVLPLKRVVAVPITDGPHETPQFVDEGVPFVSAEAVSSGRIDFSKIRACISEEDNTRYSQKYSPKLHDIYMVKSGATTGITAIVEGRTNFNIWSPLAVIRCGEEAVPHFVLNFMRSRNFLEAVTLNWNFGTQQNIGMRVIENLPCTLPPLSEQQTIAAFLDRETAKIDALIAEQQRLMALLAEKRQATISHAVTKGLNPDAPMKDSGIEWLGEVPEHWEVRRVKSVSTFITSGPRGWSERVGDDGHLFVQSGDLNNSLQVEFAAAKRVQVGDDAETSRTRLSDGDVVVCITGAKTGNVAVCTVVPETAYVNQHLCLIRPNWGILPFFLAMLLKSKIGQTYFDLSQYGLKQGLSLENIKEAPVLLPPFTEQVRIVAFLEMETAQLDTLTSEAQRAITLLQERRDTLISAAVTGKINVQGVA